LRSGPGVVILQGMSDDRKASEDLREGLNLLLRAARTTAKRVDVSKLDKGLDRAMSETARVVTAVGRVLGDEINRIAKSPPPWAKPDEAKEGKGEPAAEGRDEPEGEVKASEGADASEPKPRT
jgi:hypothetical protein